MNDFRTASAYELAKFWMVLFEALGIQDDPKKQAKAQDYVFELADCGIVSTPDIIREACTLDWSV